MRLSLSFDIGGGFYIKSERQTGTPKVYIVIDKIYRHPVPSEVLERQGLYVDGLVILIQTPSGIRKTPTDLTYRLIYV